MYYPILRARQFELIALRELATEEATQGVILPILEPVKETHNNLTLAHQVFQNKNQTAYLILNPTIGELAGDSNYYLEYLSELEDSKFLPAFHYRNNSDFINQSIESFGLNSCMIICQNDVNPEDLEFRQLLAKNEVSSLNVGDPNRNRTLHRYIKSLNKNYIRLDDLFEKQARNSDYLEICNRKITMY